VTPLSPDQWHRVRALFEQACELPAEERPRFVADAVIEEPLRDRVRSLLAAHDRGGDFLESPWRTYFETGVVRDTDLVDTQLGPYHLEEKIGVGGMGDVYRARDPRLKRQVAVKVLPARAAASEASRQRFQREAQAVAALNHPHICTLYDVGVAQGSSGSHIPYLVMELLNGETLADRLAHAPLPRSEALEYAIQIASALNTAHRARIVHRDLKPGNIMITPSGAKLLDFGLATAGVAAVVGDSATSLSASTSGGTASTMLGTLSYMAPERLRGEPADARSDLYAFGCVLYEMVTGRKAFGDRRTADDEISRDPDVPPALDREALIRAGLDEVVSRCLATDPAQRWQTADALLDALRRASAVDATWWRRPRYAITATAIVLLAIGVSVWSYFAHPAVRPLATATQLAVLPLGAVGNLSGDEYLQVAIADAVITRLAVVRQIGLRPTTAVLKYANSPGDSTAVAKALGVNYLLTGTIRRNSSAYRVTFQLVQSPEGSVMWAQSYDVAGTGLLDLQDTVAEQVVEALRVELGADQRDRLRRRYTARTDAYREYLKGRASLLNYTEAGMPDAIAAFERAVALDPDYALAHAGLAIANAWFSIRYAEETQASRWGARAEAEARAALASDPSLAEATLAIAGAAGTVSSGFNWPVVIEQARRALEIDRTLELAHVVLMRAYFHYGLFDRMNSEAEIAHRLNPLGNVEVSRLEVASSLFSGAYERARDQATALLARSDAPVIRNYLGLAQFYTGDIEGARRTLAAVQRQGRPDVRSQAALASVEAAAGDRDTARRRALAIEHGPYLDHHVAYSLAGAWAQLGDVAAAVRWLQSAADTGFPCFPSVERDPLFDPIRAEVHFRTFLERLRQRFQADAARYSAPT
jgi:serine/threonine protein kinase/TolB-like protein